MDINKEISNLPPSQNLLSFYKKKILDHEKYKEDVNFLLEKYKNVATPSKQTENLIEMERDVAELKETLSDANVFIHAERQQVSQLHLEKERLKVEQLISEKKISILLKLCGLNEGCLELLVANPKKFEALRTKIPYQSKFFITKMKELFTEKGDNSHTEESSLTNSLRLVENNFEKAKISWVEEKNALLEDRNLLKDEMKAQMNADQTRMRLLSARLDESQKSLYEATEKAVKFRSDVDRWRGKCLAQQEKICKDTQFILKIKDSGCCADSGGHLDNLNDGNIRTNVKTSCELKRLNREVSELKRELNDAEELKHLYDTKCTKMQRQLYQYREGKDTENAALRNRVKKLQEQNALLEKQRDRERERRLIQVEGFLNELKLVKDDLRKLIQQFFKLTNFLRQSDSLAEEAEVEDMKSIAALARKINFTIADAKKKLVNLETTLNEGCS